MGFIDDIKAKAKTCKKTIVLPETEDIRTYEAAEAVIKEGTANIVLIGSEEEIAKNKGSFDVSGATIVDPAKYEKTDAYIAKLVELRQKKGMTEEQARELLLTNYMYFGVMMVKLGYADGQATLTDEALRVLKRAGTLGVLKIRYEDHETVAVRSWRNSGGNVFVSLTVESNSRLRVMQFGLSGGIRNFAVTEYYVSITAM